MSHRLFRESCVKSAEGVHIKDLRVFANRDIKNLILIDNAAYSFKFQMNNGIPIAPFYDNKLDNELRSMIPYLKSLSKCNDVRDFNQHYLRLDTFAESSTFNNLIENLTK